MSHVIVRTFVAWGENCEDPFIEALHHGPVPGNVPWGTGGLMRTVAFASLCTGLTLVGSCGYLLLRAWWRDISASLLWWWTLVYALLQTAVLPSRVAVVLNLWVELWVERRVAAAVSELMYGWLIIGVVVRICSAPYARFPEFYSAVGWILLFSFVRSAAVDIYQLLARSPNTQHLQLRGTLRGDSIPAPAAVEARASRRGGLLRKRHCCEGDHSEAQMLNMGCSICLVDFEEGAKLIQLPCRHAFHSRCISKWLKCSSRCPLCMCAVFEEGTTEGQHLE